MSYDGLPTYSTVLEKSFYNIYYDSPGRVAVLVHIQTSRIRQEKLDAVRKFAQ